LKEAERVLEPFAEAATLYDANEVCVTHGNVELWQQVTRIQSSKLNVDHLRAARAFSKAQGG
jgi:lipopolysaccharide export system protein LptA